METGHEKKVELAITYSAYRELELTGNEISEKISQAILDLAEEPKPEGSVMLDDCKRCYYLAVDDWYILYHLTEENDCLTILGVLYGAQHTVH